jgi:hypothetical protein
MFSALQRTARLSLTAVAIAAGGAVVSGGPRGLRAQQPKPQRPAPSAQAPRRQETIEIRGQVPTPQVVTVRPRETPAYSRRVLVPTFFDHDFWPSILPPLQIVSPIGGATPADSTSRVPADSATRSRPVLTRPPLGTPPAPLRR